LSQAGALTFDIDNDYFEERFAVDKNKFKKDRDERLERLEKAREQAKMEDEQHQADLTNELAAVVKEEKQAEPVTQAVKKVSKPKKSPVQFFDEEKNIEEEVPEDFFDKGNPPPNLPIG
jgi:hypothetical protein